MAVQRSIKTKKFRRGRVYLMLIISYVSLLTVSMCFAAVSYSRLYETSRQHAQEQVTRQFEQAAYIVDGYVESVRQSILSLGINAHVNAFVYTKPPMTTDDYYRVSQVIDEVSDQAYSNPYLHSLFVYVSSLDCIVSNSTRLSTQDYYRLCSPLSGTTYEQWLEMLQTRTYFSVLPVQEHALTGVKLLPFCTSFPLSTSPLGAVVGYMNISQIEKVFFSSSLLNEGTLCILDEDGTAIATLYGAQYDDQSASRTFTVSIQGSGSLTYSCTLPDSIYLDTLRSTRSFIVLMLVFELLGVSLFSIALLHMNYSPLRRLLVALGHTPNARGRIENEYELIRSATDRMLTENSSLTSRLLAQQPLLKNSFIHRLLDGSVGAAHGDFADYGVNLSFAPYTVLLLHVASLPDDEEYTVFNYSLINIWEGWFEGKAVCYALEYAQNTLALLLCAPAQEVDALVDESIAYLQTQIQIAPSVGVGATVDTIGEISLSCRQAREALDYAVGWRKTGATRYDALPSSRSTAILLPAQEQELTQLLRDGEGNRACALLRRLFLHARSEPLIHIRVIVFNIVTVCLRLLEEWKIDSPIRDELDHINMQISSSASPDQLCESLCAVVEQICVLANQLHGDHALQLSESVMRVIDERFPDVSLSLTQVAEELGFNASYLSHIFKQQTNSNFVDALNDRRLSHACVLLRTTTLTVQSIAEQCGYTSAGYLNRVFKKKYSLTPGQYRNAEEIGL